MAFGSFTVLAGDFATDKGACQIAGGFLYMKQPGRWLREKIPASEILSIDVASQESAKSFGGAAAAGLAGGLLLGPVGLLAGVMAGGNKSVVTFTMTLRDGRRCLCAAEGGAYQSLQAATFGTRPTS